MLEDIRNKLIKDNIAKYKDQPTKEEIDKNTTQTNDYIDGILDMYNDTKHYFFIIDKNEAQLEKPKIWEKEERTMFVQHVIIIDLGQ